MTDNLEDTSLKLKDEMDLYRTIMDKLWYNRSEFQKEKEALQEVRAPPHGTVIRNALPLPGPFSSAAD